MNWGVLGCANIAVSSVIPAILKKDKNAKVTIASRNLEKAKTSASHLDCDIIEGYDDLLNIQNIEAIYIPLPTGLHYEWIKGYSSTQTCTC